MKTFEPGQLSDLEAALDYLILAVRKLQEAKQPTLALSAGGLKQKVSLLVESARAQRS